MNHKIPNPHVVEKADHDLADHSGVIRASTDPVHAVVDVEFNPAVLSDSDVRSLLKEHIAHVESSIRKQTFRLEGNACEACAQKLEKKVGKIPGVRRATATYLGKVLSVTFDSDIEPEDKVAADVKKTGADIKPLAARGIDSRSLWQKIRAGELNEEISCGLGLVFLIAALIVEKTAGIVGGPGQDHQGGDGRLARLGAAGALDLISF